MNQLDQFIQTARAYGYLVIAGSHVFAVVVAWVLFDVFNQPLSVVFAALGIMALILPIIIIWPVSNLFLRPLRYVWQAILFISPDVKTPIPAPDIVHMTYGKELAENLVRRVYQLADASQQFDAATKSPTTAVSTTINPYFVLENLPLPIVVLGHDRSVLFANHTFADYINKPTTDITGNNVYSLADLSFTSTDTLDNWLDESQDKEAVATRTWERVRIDLEANGKPETKYIDLAAYYNQENPEGVETVLVLFDHSKLYAADDDAIDFVALAVHELRTPLTMLRGYIEVLEEETAGKLTPELDVFVSRMQASGQQLAAFVNNILNVARVNENQLSLNLQEVDWTAFIQHMMNDLALRARVRDITLQISVPAQLPTVGADKISMYQVVSNLIDNAIKYSTPGSAITTTVTLTKNGLVETVIQDTGRGIPAPAIPHLFEKFYRDHHNRREVGGTGMGLYLVRTFVEAHEGSVWVRSKEGQGSSFGFTLKPYAELAEEHKNRDTKGIVRNAHGWIKNHSMYRR